MTDSVAMWWPDGPNKVLRTDFGVVDHPRPYPESGDVGELVAASVEFVDALLEIAAQRETNPGHPALAELTYGGQPAGWRARARDGRVFLTLHYLGQAWTWEMFEAHWAPDSPHQEGGDFCIGRWPD
ncbi:hypothetical protein H7I53_18070 [Mycolicibacterium pulveris]|uniref:Uncharacterized protein n=1 Tax=Mycolicibacterium pulveris TaxID=36813 RepID=A0A7I7UBU1_MYCPV|nr:hypothetical protein [Mycolicibacterium pulveris]MCV6982122.1 hypothetical protein [Mycolicibacterium pulveris]BBY78924.1 hypothetical protein MPUL_00820 [Mycolicibacterium pulveris]